MNERSARNLTKEMTYQGHSFNEIEQELLTFNLEEDVLTRVLNQITTHIYWRYLGLGIQTISKYSIY